jgi:hypothetical protein
MPFITLCVWADYALVQGHLFFMKMDEIVRGLIDGLVNGCMNG